MIDVHAHVVLGGVMGCAGHYGPELGTGPEGRPRFRVGNYVLDGVNYADSPFMDVGRRLNMNDHLGIELQVLSPNPLTYFHHIEAPIAAEFCRWHNDELAALIAAHPDRLRGFAQVPMQDVEAACAELRRAVEKHGLLGAYIGTDFGTTLDDPALDPFWDTAVALDVPVFIHPAPWGIDGPLRDERIRKYDLDLSVGFLYEETMAICHLVYGAVLERHPRLDICLSHGGGAAAFMSGRLEHQGRTRPWARSAPVDFVAGLQRLWFDQHLHDDRSLRLLEERVGNDRLVVGTNLAGWDAPTEPAEIPFVDQYDRNARRLLRLG
ncbi:MAG: amidohydrolase family protein [Ilumatobacteraceae bacterium]